MPGGWDGDWQSAATADSGATVASLPLPAFNPGPDGIGVCLLGPPAVLLVAGGLVLVSPQFEETNVIEAFAAPASG